MTVDFPIPANHPTYPDHFPGQPVVPGVVLLDLIIDACARHGIAVTSIKSCKFLLPVEPGAKADLGIVHNAETCEIRLTIEQELCLAAVLTCKAHG